MIDLDPGRILEDGAQDLLAFLYASFLILRTLVAGVDLPGYASLMVVILFLGGIQLISLGLLALQKKRYFAELFYLASITYRDCTQGDRDRITLPTPLRKL